LHNNPATIEPLAVSVEDAARLIGLSKTAFYAGLNNGQIGPQGKKIGGRRLFSVSELSAWTSAGMPHRKEWIELKNQGQG